MIADVLDQVRQLVDHQAPDPGGHVCRSGSERHRPNLIVAGCSAYARQLVFAEFRRIADLVDAYLLVEMAHLAGLVAAGLHPNPVPRTPWQPGRLTRSTHRSPSSGSSAEPSSTNTAPRALRTDRTWP